MVTVGSKWTGGNRSFVVMARVELEGNIWIHYRLKDDPTKEFSCFEDSFIQRFRQDHTQ